MNGKMNKTVELLLELQDKDIRVFNLRKQIQSVPAEKENVKKIIDGAKTEEALAKESTMAVETKIKDVEIEINSQREKVRSLQSRSPEIKKNEEYRALLKEIDLHNSKIAGLEDLQLEHWEELEAVKQNRVKAKKALTAAESRVDAVINDLELRDQNCNSQIEKVLKAREHTAREIEPGVLARYDRLVSRRSKSPVFQMSLVSLQGEICGGCYLKVTPQVRSKVRSGEIVPCENCDALLYFGD